VRFLLNVNTPRLLGERFVGEGHSVRHCADVGLARASDAAIIEEARANNEVVVTHDLDYGQLLAFSGRSSPSVIILRVRDTSPENLYHRITAGWGRIEGPLRDGAVIVIEDAALRIRALPIVRRG
jgi:predicted nuclease of predicted toxin-antitoxin system